jgi:hypothetical protein
MANAKAQSSKEIQMTNVKIPVLSFGIPLHLHFDI